MTYASRDLEIVEGLDVIRSRPAMYVGSADAEHSLCSRLLQCAISNIAASTPSPTAIRLTLWSGGAFTLAFDGEPLSIALETPRAAGLPQPALYERFMRLTNPGADPLGVAAVVLNALSECLVVRTVHDGVWYRAAFRRGALVSLLSKAEELEESLGVNCLTFLPDSAVVPGAVAAAQARRLIQKLTPDSPDLPMSAIDRAAEKPYWG